MPQYSIFNLQGTPISYQTLNFVAFSSHLKVVHCSLFCPGFFCFLLAYSLSMALKNYLSQLIVLICSCLLATASSLNFSFPAVFNFGDSNSDTGGLAAGVAFPVGPPNGQTYFHEPSGRFCDGRVVIDFLSNTSIYTR